MFKYHRPSEKAAIGSLVAFVASLSAASAFANTPRVHQEGLDQDLSARIAFVVKSVDRKGPATLRDILQAEMRVAQWRN